MISYHPVERDPSLSKRDAAMKYASGFLVAEDDRVERTARGIVKYAWAPSVFQDGRRLKANWLSADWIGLDFDDGEMTLDDAINTFCDMTHIIGTTETHQKKKDDEPARDRFRVLLRLPSTMTDMKLYEHQLKIAHKKYPIDTKCLEAARFFFACKEIVSTNEDGYSWDIVEMTEEDRRGQQRAVNVRNYGIQAKVIPGYFRSLLINGNWPEREKNGLCFRIGCVLGPMGFSAHEIMQLIHNCPEYSGRTIDSDLAKEIAGAVTRGVAMGIADLEKLHGR